jgi:hypothetical protein
MSPLLFLAPLFLAFEAWQLVLSERYLGIKQIARGADPREMGPAEPVAFAWSLALIVYGAWMVGLLFTVAGRVHGVCLIVTTLAGLSVRRNCGLKWILVTLTFEGAVRVGLLFSLCGMVWRRLW